MHRHALVVVDSLEEYAESHLREVANTLCLPGRPPTWREFQVLEERFHGSTCATIAIRLNLSTATVKTHLGVIHGLLKVSSRHQLRMLLAKALWLHRHGHDPRLARRCWRRVPMQT